MRVFVGMSGGVDSSVTAKLLQDQGYDVTGVYMKNWTQDMPGMRCPWAEDLADAKRVAVQLGIPFKVYDFQKEYRHHVVDYMLAEYAIGRTPNPDIMCNQEVKFRLFLEAALADGADMIATGHYAKVERVATSADDEVLPRLFIPEDIVKDQTYFLYRISSAALEKTLFPLGIYTKNHVRKIAEESSLATATKKDSQGICFVGSVGIRDFLSTFIEPASGDIIEKETGEVVGRHNGAILYTLGQRHGLAAGGGMPFYVVGKDMAKNEVYVSRNLNDPTMWRSEVQLASLHWIHTAPAEGEHVVVRMRHRGALLPATITHDGLMLGEPERATTPGQSAVIYRGGEVLGGGIVV